MAAEKSETRESGKSARIAHNKRLKKLKNFVNKSNKNQGSSVDQQIAYLTSRYDAVSSLVKLLIILSYCNL